MLNFVSEWPSYWMNSSFILSFICILVPSQVMYTTSFSIDFKGNVPSFSHVYNCNMQIPLHVLYSWYRMLYIYQSNPPHIFVLQWHTKWHWYTKQLFSRNLLTSASYMGGNKIHFTLDYGIWLHPDCNWIWHYLIMIYYISWVAKLWCNVMHCTCCEFEW